MKSCFFCELPCVYSCLTAGSEELLCHGVLSLAQERADALLTAHVQPCVGIMWHRVLSSCYGNELDLLLQRCKFNAIMKVSRASFFPPLSVYVSACTPLYHCVIRQSFGEVLEVLTLLLQRTESYFSQWRGFSSFMWDCLEKVEHERENSRSSGNGGKIQLLLQGSSVLTFYCLPWITCFLGVFWSNS